MATKKTTTKKAAQLPSLDPARIKKQLMTALEKAGLYRPSHVFLLESCAFSIAYMRRVERELRALDSIIVDKVSREGNVTPVPHALEIRMENLKSTFKTSIYICFIKIDR